MAKYIDKKTGKAPSFEDDRRMCLCLEPDAWEREEQVILTKSSVRRKVNPMLGIIVQHSSYDAWIAEANSDSTKVPELMAKYFNVYQSGRVTEWMKSDRIRQMQVAKRITDCRYADGWNVFVGMDFSNGDDLFGITYLGVDMKPGPSMAGRFFADCEAWVLEEALLRSPNRPLYEKWIEQGWLMVCPGEAFDSALAVAQLIQKQEQGINMVMFGFDPAQSKQPINTLKAWLQTLGLDASTIERMVVPVAQTALNFNPIICDLEDMIKAPEPWIEFSESPLWPWEFGNARIEMSARNDLRRVVKASHTEKVDNIHALIDATYCFELSEGKLT